MKRVSDDKAMCCGCQACMLSCPTKAIHMEVAEKGFSYPVIDTEKCIKCGKCLKKCPLRSDQNSIEGQKVYAVKNKDQEAHKMSSSGGFFVELAKQVIKEGGIVYGAAFNEKLDVVHLKVSDIDDLYKLQTSKYVQSDMNFCYENISNELKSGKLVLFSGTPCQVFGLKVFLGKEYNNLITCDLVCHGVPSPKIFKNYRDKMEKKYNSKISNMNFRYKNEKGTQNMYLKFNNGNVYIFTSAKDQYYFLFSKNLILRDCCYKCKFANKNRQSDITMGDYWGISKVFKEFDDKNGVSLVILNSNKGRLMFSRIEKNFYKKESSMEKCIQPQLVQPVSVPDEYKTFWKLYNKFGYNVSAKAIKRIYFAGRVRRKIKKVIGKGERL